MLVGPGQRHLELIVAFRQAVFACHGVESRQVVRFGPARLAGREPGLVEIQRVGTVGIEQADLEVRLVLVDGVLEKVRSDDAATGQRDVEVEHVGDDVHGRASSGALANLGEFRRRAGGAGLL